MSRIAIVGAGPIGLEAAVLAAQLGHDVQVFEKGRVAENILDWGHIRLFSPFRMNSSEWGRATLAKTLGSEALPGDEELLTGWQLVERYWNPLSQIPGLSGRIFEHSQVISISRRGFPKTAGVGSKERGGQPFQLLIEKRRAQERVEFADVVLDCSGTYPHHNWLGDGGLPCVGERNWLSSGNYRLPMISETDAAGRKILVVGSGFSAATTVVRLAQIAEHNPLTQVIWITKSRANQNASIGPIARIPNDPLAERDRLAETANALAVRGQVVPTSPSKVEPPHQHPVTWLHGVAVISMREQIFGGGIENIQVELDWSQSGVPEESYRHLNCLTVDRIIANVGYRPDRSIYEELHVHECYATQGPIKLAAKLLGESSADCLAQTSHGADVLKNPEPNFFIIGSKSYGRNSNFLLQIGHQQIHDVFELLKGRE